MCAPRVHGCMRCMVLVFNSASLLLSISTILNPHIYCSCNLQHVKTLYRILLHGFHPHIENPGQDPIANLMLHSDIIHGTPTRK